MDVRIEASWKEELQDEFTQPYFRQIVEGLKADRAAGKTIYPSGPAIFRAFEATPFDTVKVVILGQDPYHGPGQAQGLSFSVPDGVGIPPSLVNIFKELHEDLGLPIPKSGDLAPWAAQGVLLLNASLTVVAHSPMSHAKLGWHHFTDSVIRRISEDRPHVAFLLWGKFAHGKATLIDSGKHLVLKAAHPSPLSAHNGFFGSRPFSKINHWLEKQELDPIDWRL
jgi:uracil-DNA glycosylase